MNQLASLGLILLLALLAGHLVKFLRIPEVTGYIFAGVVLGPSVLGWITAKNLDTLKVFSEVALGLILFSIGGVFEVSRFREFGRRAFLIMVTECCLTAALVGGGMLLIGQPWKIALLLGTIATETAAASTLMVIRETNARGLLTDTLTAIIAMNNIFCLLGYSIVAGAVQLSTSGNGANWWGVLLPLLWQIIGAAALGYLVGLLLAAWASHVVEHGEMLILLAGSVLLCVGVSNILGVSPLISSLAVGATMVNLSPKSRSLFQTLSRTDPPLYAIFFVIAGADLNLALLPSLGVLGSVYIGGRLLAKFLGATGAAMWTGAGKPIRSLLGFAMLAQAGLAIGLVLITRERFPDLAPVITTVVLSAVAVFEIIGPVSARLALIRSGEVHPEEDRVLTMAESLE